MKKYIIILSLFAVAACTKDISRFNEQTKSPGIVPASTLFSSSVKGIIDGLASSSVNVNVYRLVVQHWATTTYQDEPNYDFTTRAIPQSWWARPAVGLSIEMRSSKRMPSSTITCARRP